MIVNAGFAASELGKTDSSQIQRLSIARMRPFATTTAANESVLMRHVPIAWA